MAIVVGEAVLRLHALPPTHGRACRGRCRRRRSPRGRRRRRCRRQAHELPGWPVAARSASDSRNSTLRPPRPRPRTVTVVSPPDSSTHGGSNGWPCRATCSAMPASTLPTSRASPSMLSPRMWTGHARLARRPPRRLRAPSAAWRRSASRCRARRGIAGLDAFAAAAFQDVRRRRRQRDAVAPDDASASAQVVGSATVGPEAMSIGSSPGTSERSSVTTLGRMASGREAPALDGRKMAAHAVHLADARARLQQRAVDRLLVVERQVSQRGDEQRRAAAGNEAQHEIVAAESRHRIEHAPRGGDARGIRHRVRRFDDLDSLAGHAVAVSRHHDTGQRALPVVLDGLCHRGRGLAGADDDRAAAPRRGQLAAARTRPAGLPRSRP